MSADFAGLLEGNCSHWVLRLDEEEAHRAVRMSLMMRRGTDRGEGLWVCGWGKATRRWFARRDDVGLYIDTVGDTTDPVEPVLIPFEILMAAAGLAEAHGEVEIFAKTDEPVLVCRADGEYIAVDVEPSAFPVNRSDMEDDSMATEEWSVVRHFTVPTGVLERIAESYRRQLFDAATETTTCPNTTFRFENGQMRWTTDWRRYGAPVVSGAARVKGEGVEEISIPAFHLFAYFAVEIVSGDVEFWVDNMPGMPRAIVIGVDWGMWIDGVAEWQSRWGDRLGSAFDTFGFAWDYVGTTGYRTYSDGEREILAEVITGANGGDCLRFTTLIGRFEGLHPDAATELLAMNSRLVGSRLVCVDGEVSLVVEIDSPTGPDQVTNGIQSLLAGVVRCKGLGEFLPLFVAP